MKAQTMRLIGVAAALVVVYLTVPATVLGMVFGNFDRWWLLVIGSAALAGGIVAGVSAYRARSRVPYVPPAGRFDAPAIPRVQSDDPVQWYPGVNTKDWDWSGRFPIPKSVATDVEGDDLLAGRISRH
jgi:hypothetical protein